MAADNKFRDQQLQDTRMRDLRDASFTGQITPQQALGTWTGYGYAAPTQTKTVGTGQEMARPSQNFMGPMPEATVQKQVAYNPFPAAGLTKEQQATLASQAATRAQEERQHRETLRAQREIADQTARLEAERIKATKLGDQLTYKAAVLRNGVAADEKAATQMALNFSRAEAAVDRFSNSFGAMKLSPDNQKRIADFRVLVYQRLGIVKPEDLQLMGVDTSTGSTTPQPGPTPAPDPNDAEFQQFMTLYRQDQERKRKGGK
jgi:hypothetical protein